MDTISGGESEPIFAPSRTSLNGIELFGGKFPLGEAQLSKGKWILEREQQVGKGKDPHLAPYRLQDDAGARFRGAPMSGTSGGQVCQHFALIRRDGKTFAVPVSWWYQFKREREETKTADEVEEEGRKQAEKERRVEKAFRKKFNIPDEEDEETERGKAISRKGKGRGTLDPTMESLFGEEDEQGDGWDHEEEVANEDIEGEVNKELVQEMKQQELDELEQEHLELERQLKKEGRKGKNGEGEEEEDLKLDIEDDEEEDLSLALGVDRREEQLKEQEGVKRIEKLRKRLKKHRLEHPELLFEDDEDIDDDDDDDDDGPSSNAITPSQSPANSPPVAPVGSPDAQITSSPPSSPPTEAIVKAEVKRDRPEDMASDTAPVKRAHTSADVQVPTSEEGLDNAMFAAIAKVVREKWPQDEHGNPQQGLPLGKALSLVKLGMSTVFNVTDSTFTKQLTKEIINLARKGSEGKEKFLKLAGKVDSKSRFDLIPE